MDNLLHGIPRVVVYLDILVTGPSEQEHLKSLEEVLCRLDKAGLHVKRLKCSFMASSVSYLGDLIDAGDFTPYRIKFKQWWMR